MNSKEKMFTERILGKIEVLKSHIESLIGEAKENEGTCFIIMLKYLDASFEQLRHENSQDLICRYLYLFREDSDQKDEVIDLIKRRDLIDPAIIAWVPDYEICQTLGLQLKDLNKHVENGQLSMMKIKDWKFLNWSEVKKLTGNI